MLVYFIGCWRGQGFEGPGLKHYADLKDVGLDIEKKISKYKQLNECNVINVIKVILDIFEQQSI